MAKRIKDITHEEFTEALAELVSEMGGLEILQVPGCYEALSEHLNNDVIAKCLEEPPDADEEQDP